MENDEVLKDEFLQELIGKSTTESPSGDFVEKVMTRIQAQPTAISLKKQFFHFLKSFSGYFLLAAILTGFFWTSDIPILSWLPGKQYFTDVFLPSFHSLFTGIKVFSGGGKSFSLPLMILVASGLFFVLDKLLTRRNVVRHHPSV